MFSRLKKAIHLSKNQKLDWTKFPNLGDHKTQYLQILKSHSTPIFVFHKNLLNDRLSQLQTALKQSWSGTSLIAYSFKTNPEPAILKEIYHHNGWAEVVSFSEYQRVKASKIPDKHIIFNGPHKPLKKAISALNKGAHLNLDHESELKLAPTLINSSTIPLNIGLRVNTALKELPKSRFGFNIESGQAEKAIQYLIANNLPINTLHVHLGTDIDNCTAYHKSAVNISQFIFKIESIYKIKLTTIDFGGGFPSHGLKPIFKYSWNPQPINQYIQAITSGLSANSLSPHLKTLILEPGRYLVDDASVFITQVIHQQIKNKHQTITVDATTAMLPLIYYRPQIIKIFDPKFLEKSTTSYPTQVLGASCREDDCLTNNHFPLANVGDYLVFFCTGAYNSSLASDFIFPKPPIIFI